MEKNTMGTFLAALRRAKGMTQKELAEQLNVSDKAVSRWERDESYPDVPLLSIIADTFDITVDELLRGQRNSAGDMGDLTAARTQEKSMKRYQMIMKQTLSEVLQWNVIMLSIVLVIAIVGMVLFFESTNYDIVGGLMMVGGGLIGIGFGFFTLIRAYAKLPAAEGYEELNEAYRSKLLKRFRIVIAIYLIIMLNIFSVIAFFIWGLIDWNMRKRRSLSVDAARIVRKKMLRTYILLTCLILLIAVDLFLEDGMLFGPHRVFFQRDSLVAYLEKNVHYDGDGYTGGPTIEPLFKVLEYEPAMLASSDRDVPDYFMYVGETYRFVSSEVGGAENYLTERFCFRNEKAEIIRASSNRKFFLVTTCRGEEIGFAVSVGLLAVLGLLFFFSPLLIMKNVVRRLEKENQGTALQQA